MKLARLIFALGTVALAAFGQGSAPASQPRLVCLFLDLNSMSPQDQAKAQESAIQFVEQQAGPSDLVEIATYTSRLNVVQDFTSDHDSLIAALRTIVPAEPTDSSNDLNGRLQAIQTATDSLARFPQRKALVYFASGVTAANDDDKSGLKAAVDAVTRANVAVWSIDPSASPASR
jgi:VWFA-related protein